MSALPEPVAWADDRANAGRIGSIGTAASKAYWERNDKATAARLIHPLYSAEQMAAAVAQERAKSDNLLSLLARYRNETPLGHQPHMIAHEVDKAIAKATGAE